MFQFSSKNKLKQNFYWELLFNTYKGLFIK